MHALAVTLARSESVAGDGGWSGPVARMPSPSSPLRAPLEAGALSLGWTPAGDPMILPGARTVGGARLYIRNYEQHRSAQPLAWSPEYYLSSPLLSRCRRCPAAVPPLSSPLLSLLPPPLLPLPPCLGERPSLLALSSRHMLRFSQQTRVFHADWAMARREEQNGNEKEPEAVPAQKMQREDVWKSKKKRITGQLKCYWCLFYFVRLKKEICKFCIHSQNSKTFH